MSKKVLITGAAKGIGKAVAVKFAEEGYDIAINYRNREKAEELEELLREINPDIEVLSLYGDISKYEDCEKIFDEIKKSWKILDVLVNNAGIRKDSLILRMSPEDFREVIDVNLMGSFNCMKLAIPLMMKNKYGRIISIASVSGVYGNAGQANYSASKAGLIGLSKAVAKEVGRKNITVNTVSPGFIKTDMTENLSEEILKNAAESSSLRRTGEGRDIAEVCFFLAEKADYITGQNIIADGGLV